MTQTDKINDLIWEFENGSQNAFEVIQNIKKVCSQNDIAIKPINQYSNKQTEALIDFECYVRNIIDSTELTDAEKTYLIKKQL